MGEAVDLINLLGDSNEAAAEAASSGGHTGDQDEDLNSTATVNIHIVRSGVRLKGFARLDEAFLKPFFTRKFTDEVPSFLFLLRF